MKWIFIHSWHLFHSKSLQILLHSICQILHFCLIWLSSYLECDFIQPWQMFHSMFHFCWPPSMTTSFPNGNRFILYFIPPWQLFHAIFHSFRHSFQLNFHFFMAATSFSLGFCLIPSWQLLHAIFHSSWHVFDLKFHFFMVATSFFLWILSHSSLAAISCNISFLLAFISIKFSFHLKQTIIARAQQSVIMDSSTAVRSFNSSGIAPINSQLAIANDGVCLDTREL